MLMISTMLNIKLRFQLSDESRICFKMVLNESDTVTQARKWNVELQNKIAKAFVCSLHTSNWRNKMQPNQKIQYLSSREWKELTPTNLQNVQVLMNCAFITKLVNDTYNAKITVCKYSDRKSAKFITFAMQSLFVRSLRVCGLLWCSAGARLIPRK